MTYEFEHRQFLKTIASTGLGATLGIVQSAASAAKVNLPPIHRVRIGIIGVGRRGSGLMDNLLQKKENVQVKAVCDIYPDRAKAAQQRVTRASQPKPEAYSGSEHIWKKLVERDDIDAVIIGTYCEWHTPMAVYVMKTGKYAGVEVP
ncbi:MAG: Gfo/Idh/MocA family protein [Planctomycetota bacterium]|jgi:predicted dehydrogenase